MPTIVGYHPDWCWYEQDDPNHGTVFRLIRKADQVAVAMVAMGGNHKIRAWEAYDLTGERWNILPHGEGTGHSALAGIRRAERHFVQKNRRPVEVVPLAALWNEVKATNSEHRSEPCPTCGGTGRLK